MQITDEKDSSKAFYLTSVNFVLLFGVIACIYEQQSLINPCHLHGTEKYCDSPFQFKGCVKLLFKGWDTCASCR